MRSAAVAQRAEAETRGRREREISYSVGAASRLLPRTFPSFRSVKHHPNEQVVGEVFETMREACRCPEEIVRLERFATVAMHERAAAADHHVALVARVRLLRVRASRRVELHRERAVLEDERRSFALRAGDAIEESQRTEQLAVHPSSVTVV